jgi:hypothetical protein
MRRALFSVMAGFAPSLVLARYRDFGLFIFRYAGPLP